MRYNWLQIKQKLSTQFLVANDVLMALSIQTQELIASTHSEWSLISIMTHTVEQK